MRGVLREVGQSEKAGQVRSRRGTKREYRTLEPGAAHISIT